MVSANLRMARHVTRHGCQRLKRNARLSAMALALIASAISTTDAQTATDGAKVAPSGHVRMYKFQSERGVDKTPAAVPNPSRAAAPNATPKIAAGTAPAGALLTYNGGRVVSALQAVIVLWGSGSYESQISSTGVGSMLDFYQQVLGQSTLPTWLDSEYNTVDNSYNGTQTDQHIGKGTVLGLYTIVPSIKSATIDDTQIQSELDSQIMAGHLPSPETDAQGNAITYYAIYFPPGITITQGNRTSCAPQGFCSYHGTIAADSALAERFYGVHPDLQAGSACNAGCGNASAIFGNYTAIASKEIADTITDGEVGLATTSVGPPLAWLDSTNGEIGDLCNAQQASFIACDGQDYTVQLEFSNALANCTAAINKSCSAGGTSDFTIGASPSSFTFSQGDGTTGTSTISTSQVQNPGTVNFTLSGVPSGATASIIPPSVAAGGSSTLTVDPGTAAPGTYTITLTGTEGSNTHSGTILVTIKAIDFAIGSTPFSLTLQQGAVGTASILVSDTTGNGGIVALTVSGVPSGATGSVKPTSVTATGSSTLTIDTGTAAPGNYTITVTGTGAAHTHSTSISLTITGPDFTIGASPGSLSLAQGASGTSAISTTAIQTPGTVSFSVSGVPSGASASVNPTSVTAGGSSSFSVNTGTAAAGIYIITVTGTDGTNTHSTNISLTITAPPVSDFSIAASPSSLSVVSGASGGSTISTAVTSGVAGTVNLSISGLPSGASASLGPTSVTAGSSSTLSVNTGTAAAGVYTLTVTGTEGANTHSTNLSLTVTALPVNDFSISDSPNSLTIAQGASGATAIPTAIVSGSPQSISLSTSGLPAGASAAFSPAAVSTGNFSTLTISTGAAAPGVYAVTVTGTSSSFSHSTSLSLTITGSKLSSVVQLTSSANPALIGKPVTYTAAVASSSGGTPTGTVTFLQGGVTVATVPLSGGAATYTTSYPAAGVFSIRSVYSGDAQFLTSTSATLRETVTLNPVTVSVVADSNPSTYGQTVTFTATLSTPGPSLDGRTVIFAAGLNVIGSAVVSGGMASVTTSALNAGTATVRALYAGDPLHRPASGSMQQKVNKAVTTLNLVSSANPSPLGQAVTFTATVSSSLVTPTGSVTFKTGNIVLGTVALSGGVASVTTNVLSAGGHSISATYNNSNFTSSSSSLTEQVH